MGRTGLSRFLADVNVLIALVDADHEFNAVATAWIAALGEDSEWLTCPITENGAVRIKFGPGYPTGPLLLAEVVDSVLSLRELGQHRFIGDSISITDTRHFSPEHIIFSRRLTDAYLVALAAANGATFVTLDSRLVTGGVVSDQARVVFLGSELRRSRA